MKILVMGLPGSGKSTLAKPLAKLLNGVWINADQVRTKYDDWDFTPAGRMRQSMRMKFLSDGVNMTDRIAVADFVCPTEAARSEFNADFTVWMDTIEKGRFEDTNVMFEKPLKCNYHVNNWFTDTDKQLMEVVKIWMNRNG